MLTIHDIIRPKGMTKLAQSDGFGGGWGSPSLVTLGDIYSAITADRGLSPVERDRVLAQVRQLAGGAGESTRVSQLMSGAIGGILGQLIAKYFGMGVAGQVMSAAGGFGLGRTVYNALNKPEPKYRGYQIL